VAELVDALDLGSSGVPNYTKNALFLKIEGKNPKKQWRSEKLVSFVYPKQEKNTFLYSNTNYILLGMIIHAATGHSFADELKQRILSGKYKLSNTYYSAGPYPSSILKRMVRGYYHDSREFPGWMGRDRTDNNMSWAGTAGAMVSNTDNLIRWVRALFSGDVLPAKQLTQLNKLVSEKTGKKLDITSVDDPKGYGLGVQQVYRENLGRFWFYEGRTSGYRIAYLWFPCTNIILSAAANSSVNENKGEDKLPLLLRNAYHIILNSKALPNCDRAPGNIKAS